MAEGTTQILGFPTSAAPIDYLVSGSQDQDLIAVNADYDGSGCAVSYQAVVEIISGAGEVMARGVGPTIAAGDSASMTFAPFLGEEIGGAGPTLTLDQVIVALLPDAWWKLNESSGTIAHDSSGNGWDLTVQAGGYVAPTWAQPAGPPGTQTANFTAGAPGAQVASTTFPAMSGDLTAMIFANRDGTLVGGIHPFKFLIGQGDPVQPHHRGFDLEIEASNQGSGDHGLLIVGSTTVGPSSVETDIAITTDVWHLHAVTRTAGTWRQYIDGALQSHTFAGSYDATSGVWLGTDTTFASQTISALMSYGMVWGARALTGAEILSVAQAAGL